MHEVLVNRLGGLSLPRKSVVKLTYRPDMTLDDYRGRKTTTQLQQQSVRGQLVNSYTTLQPNTLKFFVGKMREALQCKGFSHIFNKNSRAA